MAPKKKSQSHRTSKVNEPLSTYLSGTTTIPSEIIVTSFEEQEEEMRIYWASITPKRRLKELHTLICMSFGLTKDKLNNPIHSDEIRITPTDEYLF